MRMIWKYTLGHYSGMVEISVPEGGIIRSVGLQNASCQVWIEVDPLAPPEQRHFEIVGTGNVIPLLANVYCGTVLAHPFIWHIYEKIDRSGVG